MDKAVARPAYHSITPSIVFDDAAAAIEFYKRAFGAQELSRMPGPAGSIMHAELKIGDSVLMVSDAGPGARSARSLGGSPVVLQFFGADVDGRFQRALSAGCKEVMPLADQFWGDRYGILLDPFGLEWGMGQHVREVSESELRSAAQKLVQQMEREALH